MAIPERIVVVGAGQAGFSVCEKLRAKGVTAALTLVGDEGRPPYQRPPLSKGYLLGKKAKEYLFFRPADFYAKENIELLPSAGCSAIDRERKEIRLGDGRLLSYDVLVLATGARPVRLPQEVGGSLHGVHYMRTLADADRLAEDLALARNLLVVGGGYVGLEAAAVAVELGISVTLVEASPRILGRVASEETSRYFREMHRRHGVDLREGTALERLAGEGGRLKGARLTDGSDLAADVAVVGIGIRPNQELAAAAGLQIENGIWVDSRCRTSDPDIFAVGDCCSFPHEGERIRLESVGNAIDQGHLVAQVISGEDVAYRAKPWFWSDQYDTKLQIAGLSQGYDRIVTRQGDGDAISFWYYRGDRLLAIDAMNDSRAYMVGKRLIESQSSPDPEHVKDGSIDLKSLLQVAPARAAK